MKGQMLRPDKAEREAYFVDYPPDTEYSAYARWLQSKWRIKLGFPMGVSYGNYLELEFSKSAKANYLTDYVKNLVTHEIQEARKSGGLIGEPRIWDNLLSSQPLCFNLFGEMHRDLHLASRFFKMLFPERVDTVLSIKFEYSPGRKNEKYTADNSAFDVFVEYSNQNRKGFIGIEVKYAESLKEETPEKAAKNYRPRYGEITAQCGVFKPDVLEKLKLPPISQIWRDHLLSIATRQDYDEGFFVFLYPAKNDPCEQGVKSYLRMLFNEDESATGFYPRHLETFVETLRSTCDAEWARELQERYLGP